MSNPRPVIHLDGERGFRGGERQLLYLAEALRARGRRGVIAARAGSELALEAARRGFDLLSLPYYAEYDPLTAARVAACARREGAILHAHAAHAAGVAALAAAAGLPYVAHRRVDFAVSPLSARLKYGRAARVVAVSNAIAKILTDAGVPAHRVAVVPDSVPADAAESGWAGVDAGRFAPATGPEKAAARRALAEELGIDPEATWIGNLAALVPHKDHDTLLAAAVIVTLKRPGTRFLIAGRGPEERRLFESIRRMGLVGKVVLAGHREDPIPLLKSLDVYAQSSWGEGMGSVLLEAAACGVPTAATTAGGIPEVVADGETGLLVPPRDPEALAGALVRLVDDAALRERLAAAARRRLPVFGLRRMAERMEEIYGAIVP